MGVTIADLLAKTKPVSVKLDKDVSIGVEFRISAFTPEFDARLKSVGEGKATQAELLAELIEGWDIVGEDGNPVPVTTQTLESLGTVIQNALFNGILEAAFPNAKTP